MVSKSISRTALIVLFCMMIAVDASLQLVFDPESRKMFWENQQVLNDGEVDEIVDLATKAYYDADHASGYFLRGKKDLETIHEERRSLNPGDIPEFVERIDQSNNVPYVIEVKRGADSGRISPTQRRRGNRKSRVCQLLIKLLLRYVKTPDQRADE